MIIDSHCHLEYEPMCLALDETISRANRDGVKFLLTISTTDKSFVFYPCHITWIRITRVTIWPSLLIEFFKRTISD